MKISKKILLVTLILFIFVASGCSKNLLRPNGVEPDSKDPGVTSDLEVIDEKLGEGDSSDAPDWTVAPGRSFGSAEQGMPGDGATGSFSAEPFVDDSGLSKAEKMDEGDFSDAPDWTIVPGRSFGSAEQGMPGDGSTGSFSAEPFLTEKGEDMVIPVPRDEEVRRLLPYQSIDRLTDIHFAFDKSDLDDKSRAILQANAAYLKTHPASRVEIQGHCDERGSNSYNISLGERRAHATQSYLTSLGVEKSRIRTLSYGEERPFCFESNEACWYQNRRAHFLIAEPTKNQANPPR